MLTLPDTLLDALISAGSHTSLSLMPPVRESNHSHGWTACRTNTALLRAFLTNQDALLLPNRESSRSNRRLWCRLTQTQSYLPSTAVLKAALSQQLAWKSIMAVHELSPLSVASLSWLMCMSWNRNYLKLIFIYADVCDVKQSLGSLRCIFAL